MSFKTHHIFYSVIRARSVLLHRASSKKTKHACLTYPQHALEFECCLLFMKHRLLQKLSHVCLHLLPKKLFQNVIPPSRMVVSISDRCIAVNIFSYVRDTVIHISTPKQANAAHFVFTSLHLFVTANASSEQNISKTNNKEQFHAGVCAHRF